MKGVSSQGESFIRAPGEGLDRADSLESVASEAALLGLRAPIGEGHLGAPTAGQGTAPSEAQSRRGSQRMAAQPAADRADQLAVDAIDRGKAAGSSHQRQAAAKQAAADPVREARIASGQGGGAFGGEARALKTAGSGGHRYGPAAGHGRGHASKGRGRSSDPFFDDYLRAVKAKVRQHWSYPPEAVMSLDQGLVVLSVRVRHDGSVDRVTVQRSSGMENLDEYAVQAVQSAAPLGPPPPELLHRRGRDHLDLPFRFRYRNPMFE